MKISLTAVQKIIHQFLNEQKKELEHIDFVIGVSRGGLIPAVLIATAIDKPLVSAYIDRQDRVYLDRSPWIKNKRLLLVDDIVRTGSTFKKIITLLKRYKPKTIQSFTLYGLQNAAIQPTWTHLVATDRSMPWDIS